jgi:hypothetical protein
VFENLFKRKAAPTNQGTKAPNLPRTSFIKNFYLELSNLEGSPSYALKHQLTIGSEIGNIVIADQTISPRHATFSIQDGVVSLLDHGSVMGTKVNGQPIGAGKNVILQETDIVLLGELEVKILAKNEAKAEYTAATPIEIFEKESTEIFQVKEIQAEPAPKPVSTSEVAKAALLAKKKKATKTKRLKGFFQFHEYSANTIIRLFSLLGDGLLSYIIVMLFMPFDEFRGILNETSQMLGEISGIQLSKIWDVIPREYHSFKPMVEDVLTLIPSDLPLINILLTFALVRFVSTLIFGVSASELIFGVKGEGNFIWNRLGGALRVVLGFFTGPFIIFDLPALISRRTLKEFLTHTNTYLNKKLMVLLGLLYVAGLFVLALVSPLFQGLETPTPISFDPKIETRIRVQTPAVDPQVEAVNYRSTMLSLELPVRRDQLFVLPMFKFQGSPEKLKLQNQLSFFDRNLQRQVTFEAFKHFDLKGLLALAISGNYQLSQKYQIINGFVHDSPAAVAFKKDSSAKAHEAFAREVISLTETAMKLSAENFTQIMEEETLQLKGLVDYKTALLNLLEYKDFDSMGVVKIGNTIFLKVSYLRQKPHDLLIPLQKAPGKVFRVEFDSKNDLGKVSSLFYKFHLDKTNWLNEDTVPMGETMGPLEVFDYFSQIQNEVKNPSAEKAQALYGYYYETGAALFTKNDVKEIELFKESVHAVADIMKVLVADRKDIPADDPFHKLLQNFLDLRDAVDAKNGSYFGVAGSTTI